MENEVKTDVCIFPKDVQRITGRSERYGRLLLHQIRKHFDKQPHQFVTAEEFAEFTGVNIETVNEYLKN
ncbi:hypothetical protein EI546_03530 [Aequorivita sp. H23M31]|uniref:Uncharacterized protein n=1 Tax=Aequorivita ciconiae TaxID=2494375 RepID=A0A410G786_9FLAO|nr:hypothetical protein EI546_03530 [Aequorivita sp. H23M31]